MMMRVVTAADLHTPPAVRRTGLRAVGRSPGAPTLILAALLASVAVGATGLLLILQVRHLGGSFAFAGLVSGSYLFGSAASAPVVGRAIDRFGQTVVLAITVVCTAAALVAIALVPADAPDVTLPALAVLAGLLHPPVTTCTLALLPDVIPDRDTLHSAYALESSAMEVSYIVGPLVIGGLIASYSTRLGLIVCAFVLTIGTVWLLSHPASRGWRPTPPAPGEQRSRLGAIGSPAIRVLLLTVMAFSVSFGAIEVAVTAAASDLGHPHAAGALLSAWGLGSLVGGLLAARATAPQHPERRLVAILAALVVGDLLLVLTAGSWALAALLPVSGLAIAPAIAGVNAMAGAVAATGTKVEAYAWLGTGVTAGFSLGAILAGSAAHAAGPPGGFGIAAAAAAAAIAVFTVGWTRRGVVGTAAERSAASEPAG